LPIFSKKSCHIKLHKVLLCGRWNSTKIGVFNLNKIPKNKLKYYFLKNKPLRKQSPPYDTKEKKLDFVSESPQASRCLSIRQIYYLG
jgi:hypothetical protein